MKLKDVEKDIEQIRTEMIGLALTSSFNNELVILTSSKLDKKLNEYEALKRKTPN